MKPPQILADFPSEYQTVLIDYFKQHEEDVSSIASQCISQVNKAISNDRMAQFVIMAVLSLALGVSTGSLFNVLLYPSSLQLFSYIQGWTHKFPGRSTTFPRIRQLEAYCLTQIQEFASNLLDHYYSQIGFAARQIFKEQLQANHKDVTVSVECFLGLMPASAIFSNIGVKLRGILLPFFNFRFYSRAQRTSSIAEIIGELHTPDYDAQKLSFRTAAKCGFLGKVPGIVACYKRFHQVEEKMHDFEAKLDPVLIQQGILQLTALSLDTTNIPVDKRDHTGSQGKGSRGTFFGHKSSVGCGANCVPINQILGNGRTADTALFSDTFQPIVQLAQQQQEDIWVVNVDAGYSDPKIVQEIEQAHAIPVIDINPKNSILLN
jgi:hypothetical protein